MTEAQTTDHVRGLLDRDEITWDEAFAMLLLTPKRKTGDENRNTKQKENNDG